MFGKTTETPYLILTYSELPIPVPMNKRYVWGLLLYLLKPLFLFSQTDEPAFIVQFEGDTIRGRIEYGRWELNPEVIQFKKDAGSQPISYTPSQIRAFSVAGQAYESGIVQVDVSPYKIEQLSIYPEPDYRADTVFLRSLVRGAKDLLYLKDQKGKVHFYVQDDGYKPLLYKQYVRAVYVPHLQGFKKSIFENNSYKGQLALFLKDCASIQEKMHRLKYDPASLTRLFTDYHTCTSRPLQYTNKRKDGSFQIGALVGATNTFFEHKSPTWSSLKKFDTPNQSFLRTVC
jgi:hypothetical protein